ncbi:Box C/D snoRNA protein 1 [Orchesella cincta]|uniref:Box C/D snoRNA protein 1 n=1 Tax=Orchesella cincta TaxID=48709 RepID=A0A1D2MT21_ORCCI|nr:Box C/D snoRNA protein 1 [Orchesella cincta]
MPKEVKKRKIGKLGFCDVCKTVKAVYTCPRCETVTCSLVCVKSHKTQLDCDGVRVRTKYIPLNKMDELSFLSDYRLMEDVERCVQTAAAIRESSEVIPQQLNHVDETPKPIRRVEKRAEPEPVHSRGEAPTKSEEEPTKSSEEEPMKSSKEEPALNNKETPAKKKPRRRPHKKSKADLVSKATKIRETILMRKGKAKEQKLDPDTVTEMPDEETQTLSADSNHPVAVPKFKSKAQVKNAVRKQGDRKDMVLNTLMKVAHSRGVYVDFLPNNFVKHWENTSFYFVKENCIYWKLRVSFINANMFTLTINECSEQIALEKLIMDCLKRSHKYSRENGVEDPLLIYRTLGISAMSILMTADRLPSCQKKFYILDKQKSLQENFVGKCIVEFPQLCVALEGCHTVTNVKGKVETRFFDLDEKEKSPSSNSDEERFKKILEERKLKKKTKKEKQPNCTKDTESDRESGELTDSGGESFSSNDYSGSEEEELYDDSEFRSMYKDLLKTLDVDVKAPK